MLRLLLLLPLIALAVLVLAVRYLPWWGVFATVFGMYLTVRLGVRFAVPRLLQSVLLIPFKAKGAVLRGAEAEVHSVEPAEAPPGRSFEDEAAGDEGVDEPNHLPRVLVPREYYRIDVTIAPRPSAGPFQFWEPGEMLLIPADAKVRLDDGGDDSHLADVEIFEDGRFVPDEAGKYHGPLRLRMLFGLRPGASRRLKFRYYFEAFGDVSLPEVSRRMIGGQ